MKISNTQLEGLIACGVAREGETLTESELLEIYSSPFTWDSLCDYFSLTATQQTRMAGSLHNSVDLSLSPDEFKYGEGVHTIGKFCDAIYHVLKRRGETLEEYKRSIIAQNRKASNPNRYGGVKGSSRMASKQLNQVIDIIHTLTCKHPKAHAAFQAKLNPLGVYLPAITSQSADNEGEIP
jgi:hypothetical protein